MITRNLSDEHLESLIGNGLYNKVRLDKSYNFLWNKLDRTIGKIFKEYKVNRYVDVSRGRWHRWSAPGHDPIDVLRQIIKSPLSRGRLDFGHVFLTDFFTKDGIPLPGLSKNYLGAAIANALKSLGIQNPIKWLNMNGFDYFFGGLSLFDATSDLSLAFSDEVIEFTWETAWNTFGEGALELYFGAQTGNVMLVTSGVGEFVAGSIMLYKDLTRSEIETSFLERLIENIPSSNQILSAFGFYLTLTAFRNIVFYKLGKIDKDEIIRASLIDISTSLGCFAITKTILPAITVGGLTGGMLLPILIGAGSSILLRSLFKNIFKKRDVIQESDLELWIKSPFEFQSPWNKSIFENSENDVWQKSVFTTA